MLFVRQITAEETYPFILNIHYAHRIPSISYSYGLFDSEGESYNLLNQGELIGVVCYGTPASSTLLVGICGVEYQTIVKELNRLVLKYNRHNEASYLISQSFKQLPKPSIIVSYADTKQSHIGIVYKATNFIYTGLSTKFLDPCVKGLEHQHHATYAHGMNNRKLSEKYGDLLYYEQRARKHRYIMFLGNKSEKKKMLKALNYPILPYPKDEMSVSNAR